MLHATKLTPRLPMIAVCAAATLTLAACGHSDKASDAASADNVEMPAEETMSGLDASAVPQADASATATDQAEGADASASAADSAASADGPAAGASTAPPTAPATPIKM